MNTSHRQIIFIVWLFILSIASFAQTKETNFVGTLTTEFTYQGKLTDNNAAANGNYDFEFKLMDANGAVLGTQQKLNVAVANGIFTVRLDYGSTPFNSSGDKFLEIGVRPATTATFTILSPRQPITATPYAIVSSSALNAQFANLAADAQNLGGIAANQYVLTGDSRLSDARNPLPGSADYIQNTNIEQVANFTINGVGSAGILQAVNVNALFQYSLGGAKFITAPGTNNLFLGIGSGANWTTGANNSFFGKNSGLNTTDGAGNSFFGSNSGMQNTTGLQNSYFGWNAGLANQTGSFNSFFGTSAGTNVASGNRNSFFGTESGANTTIGSGNSFFGLDAGLSNTTGSENSYFGEYSGRLGMTVTNNAFFGAYTGNNNAGSVNSFFGYSAGFSNTSGQFNTFLGGNTGYSNTLGNSNVLVGARAGIANTTGSDNTFIGYSAGFLNTTGETNIFIGSGAGSGNATGNGNILIGRYTGNLNRNGNNLILLGNDIIYGADLTNSVAIGFGANVFTSNTIVIGTSSEQTIVRGKLALNTLETGGIVNLCMKNGFVADCSSSIRYKTDVENFTFGLDLIKKLRPVSFTWKDGGMRDLGFIAEEVNAVEPLMTTYNEKGEVEGVKYDRISTALVNAVNQQQTEIETQTEQIKQQKAQIENQERQLQLQQQQIDALKKLVCDSNAQAEICREKE